MRIKVTEHPISVGCFLQHVWGKEDCFCFTRGPHANLDVVDLNMTVQNNLHPIDTYNCSLASFILKLNVSF